MSNLWHRDAMHDMSRECQTLSRSGCPFIFIRRIGAVTRSLALLCISPGTANLMSASFPHVQSHLDDVLLDRYTQGGVFTVEKRPIFWYHNRMALLYNIAIMLRSCKKVKTALEQPSANHNRPELGLSSSHRTFPFHLLGDYAATRGNPHAI